MIFWCNENNWKRNQKYKLIVKEFYKRLFTDSISFIISFLPQTSIKSFIALLIFIIFSSW